MSTNFVIFNPFLHCVAKFINPETLQVPYIRNLPPVITWNFALQCDSQLEINHSCATNEVCR